MKEINLLNTIASLFKFKLIKDSEGNEYILFYNNQLDFIENIEDKTAFEAIENHIHIIEKVKKSDFDNVCSIGKILGKALLSCLNQEFPDKTFVVFVCVGIGQSLIIRFHQKWGNEPLYYDVSGNYEKGTKIFIFE